MADRRYETLVVMHPDLGEPASKELAAKIRGIIESQGGTISQVQEWGLRELAYLIEKQRRGIYVLFEYQAKPAALAELDRQLRIMDQIIRHISVRPDEDAPLAAPLRTARGPEGEEPQAEPAPEVADTTEGEGV